VSAPASTMSESSARVGFSALTSSYINKDEVEKYRKKYQESLKHQQTLKRIAQQQREQKEEFYYQ